MKTVKQFIHESKFFHPTELVKTSEKIMDSFNENELDFISMKSLWQKYDALWYLSMINTYRTTSVMQYFKMFNESYKRYYHLCEEIKERGYN